MQEAIDACFKSVPSRLGWKTMEQEQMRARERIVQSLMSTKVPHEEWRRIADIIEEMSLEQRCVTRYRGLIRDLKRGAIGERCQQRAALALQTLWGMR